MIDYQNRHRTFLRLQFQSQLFFNRIEKRERATWVGRLDASHCRCPRRRGDISAAAATAHWHSRWTEIQGKIPSTVQPSRIQYRALKIPRRQGLEPLREL